MKKKIQILLEDEDLILVNKPAQILTIPDRYDPDIPNIRDHLRSTGKEVFVVHRLDKGTSGVICFAKHADAHKNLSGQFEDRTVEKVYWAILEGNLRETEGSIKWPIVRDKRIAGKMAIGAKGKEAVTHYKVTAQYHHFAFVEIRIETGRTHQIRVHCSALGHPVLADHMYGKRASFFLSEIKGKRYRKGKEEVERPLLERPALHSRSLQLHHPKTGAPLVVEAPLPKDVKAVLYQLDKMRLL